MKIIVMGASGMLGHQLYLQLQKNHEVWGTVRDKKWHPELLSGYDVHDLEKVEALIREKKPDFVINCVGIIKQLKASEDKIISLEINSLWPHKLANICERNNVRMIHFSTDCVFSGTKGNYFESDLADARDTYGLSKYMGEVDYAHTLTLRTSIIGHELNSNVSLVDWFMSQKNQCKGFSKAIFSGFPTVVMANFIENYVLKNFFSGIYHFSSAPINKYELLKLVAKEYDKNIEIMPSEDLVIDRSLNSDKLQTKTGFTPPSWTEMIKQMRQHYLSSGLYQR